MEVGQGIHRLTGGVVNFYLIEDKGKLVLVDAGTPRDWDVLVRHLAEQGRQLGDLDAVLLTHAHADHTGFAERARTTAPADVWIHGSDAESARTGRTGKNEGRITSYLQHAELYRTAVSLLRRGGGRIVPVAEVSTFADGQAIDVPGEPRVVHSPGHTSGSSAIFLEARGVLLTGDCLVMRNPLTGRVGPQIMPSGLNRDSEEALRSLEVLERVPAEVILPGHGEPWTQGTGEAVRLARAAGRS